MDRQDPLTGLVPGRSARIRTLRRRLAPWALWTITIVNAGFALLLVLVFAVPLPARATAWSTVVEYRDGRPAHVFLARDDKWRLPVTLDDLDPTFVAALIALEDQRFWSHDGVDPIAIVRAAWSDLVHMRRVSGGSTITMQLARLLEPRPRTIRSKLVEMFRATQLDLRLPKREILERYLSRTPYGGNLEGVESAAWAYFGHAAKHLTPLEIATLLAVPQGPARYAPRRSNVERLRARRDDILAKLIGAGVFARVDAETALVAAASTPPPDRLRRMPREAPHAAILLRARHGIAHRGAARDALGVKRARIRSTLDAGVQAMVERTVRLHAPDLRRRNIFGGAIVVADHRTREVVALVGSLDFHDDRHGGQIAMFARPRSPGSTLKPFLYALAIDRGLALPEFLVPDVPMQYGTYRPRNFDDDWNGLVTLKDSLSRSLNLPFIELLQQLGVEAFVGELSRMGVTHARAEPGHFGLSLIVGGMELTPLELASMYATLAQDGTYQPLRLVTGSARTTAGAPIFGAGAAWLTRQALSLKDRPDFPRRRDVTRLPAAIHWKTGTSFGYRDAWAIGSGPAYTAVVWTGNVDNRSSSELVGSEAAGPVLFDVLEGLADRTHPPAPSLPPADLALVEVCAYSGHLATEACEHRTHVHAPIHAVPTAPCPYHRAYEVDRETARAVLPACRAPDRSYERKSFVVLPSAVTAWLAAQDRGIPEGPVFAEGCTPDAGGTAPEVLTPVAGQVVTLIPGLPVENQRVPLSASTRAATLSWFVDGEHVATAPSNERVFWVPSPGKHRIVVTDELGRKGRRTLDVKVGTPGAPLAAH